MRWCLLLFICTTKWQRETWTESHLRNGNVSSEGSSVPCHLSFIRFSITECFLGENHDSNSEFQLLPPCSYLLLSLPPDPPVVRQSGLQPVRPLRAASQIPPRPALLHPPPRLHVAAVGPDSKQHSGEHPAQSPLIWLHRWVRSTCTRTKAPASRRSPRAWCLCTLISQFPLPIMGGGGIHTRARACAFPQDAARWWIFYLRRAQWHYQRVARLRNALPIATAGWWRALCRPQPVPQTLHHVSARLMSAVFINFNLSFWPYTALEQSSRRWQEQLLTSGPDVPFFFFFPFSCLMCAADIFTAVTRWANISSPPRRLWASTGCGCDISFRPTPMAPFEGDLCAASVNLPGKSKWQFSHFRN